MKVLKILSIVAIFIAICSCTYGFDIKDISDVNAGVLFKSGVKSEMYWKAGITVPLVTNNTTDTVVVLNDTVITVKPTYQVILKTGYLTSNSPSVISNGVELRETAGEYVSFINHKSLGVWTLSANIGGTYLNLNNSNGADESYLGGHVGLGCVVLNMGVSIGADVYTVKDGSDMYFVGLGLNMRL